MYLQKVISRKNCVKNKFFAGILKVSDENSRIWIQNPDPNPDPLVRGKDPRIRIRGSTQKFHGFATLDLTDDLSRESCVGLQILNWILVLKKES
jgi:hypothetical protein